MIETITPAVCGSRKRHRLAVALFTGSAVLAAALVGLVLGSVGSLVGGTTALVVAAAVVAALAALRELGILRVPLPQARRQVPERWHAELPLPLWAVGYGAGLGAGAFTFQPVATYWVACAAALALAEPLPAAALFALYGAGRALMVVLPHRGIRPADAVERLVSRRRTLVRANGIVLAACAVALAFAPVAGAGPPRELALGPGNELDPSFSSGALAFTKRQNGSSRVIVREGKTIRAEFAPGQEPSLDGELLAYRTGGGVRVVRWRTDQEITFLPGATRPALNWPWLAYNQRRADGGSDIWLQNLGKGGRRRIAGGGPKLNLGRPAIAGGRVAWQSVGPTGSRIGLEAILTGKRAVAARTKIGLLAHPSLSGGRLMWVDQRRAGSKLKLWTIGSRSARTLAHTERSGRIFWTTALAGRTGYLTRWFSGKGIARIEKLRF
jgi:hypothetical protein